MAEKLTDSGMDKDAEMTVSASKVLSFCQRTLCLVGNASELISHERCSKVLEAIDPSWAKYGADNYPKAGNHLFGDSFKTAFNDKVEKDLALSKVIALTQKGKSTMQPTSLSTRREKQRGTQVFPRGPPAGYGSRWG